MEELNCPCHLCNHDWSEDGLEKRSVFEYRASAPAQGFSGGAAPVDRVGEQPNESRWQLEELDASIRKDMTKTSLEAFQQRIETGREALQQDQQSVDQLMAQADNAQALESQENRERFFGSVEERLSVLLVMLVRSQQISLDEASGDKLGDALKSLNGKADQLKIAAHGTQRGLLPQEKSLLGLVNKLPNHSNQQVQEGWNKLVSELQQNVRSMNLATEMASATLNGQSPARPDNLSPEEAGMWDKMQDFWGKTHPITKAVVLTTAAVGAWSLFKKVFMGNNPTGALGKVGALIAGGAFVAGGMAGFDKTWNMLKGVLTGQFSITQTAFFRGAKSLLSGDWKGAKEAWGDAADFILRRGEGGADTSPETREVGGENVEMVPVREAMGNYFNDMKEGFRPVTSYVEEHPEMFATLGVVLGVRYFDAIKSGLKMTKDSLIGAAKLVASAPRHPFRTLMVISAFLMAKEASGVVKIPKDKANLARYLRGQRQELSAFIQENGLGHSIPAEDVDLAAGVVSGERSVTELESASLTRQAIDGLEEMMRLKPQEKIAQENQRGMRSFVNQLLIQYGEGTPEQAALIQYAKNLDQKMREEGALFTPQTLAELQREAAKANIKVITKNGYVMWGEVDGNGNFLNEDGLLCLGVDPSLPVEEQHRLALRFVSNPNSIASIAPAAFFRAPKEQLQGAIATAIERVRKGESPLVLMDGASLVWDATTAKYVEVPMALLDGLTGDFNKQEFLFAWGEGIIPVAVVGTASSLARGAWMGNLSETFKLKNILLRSAFYPVEMGYKALAAGTNRGLRPFIRGFQAGGAKGRIYEGFAEMARFNGQTTQEFIRRAVGNIKYGAARRSTLSWMFRGLTEESLEGMKRLTHMNEALRQLRSAESAVSLGRSDQVINSLKDYMGRHLSDMTGMINEDNIAQSIRNIRQAIENQQNALKGITETAADVMKGVARESLQALRSGGSLSGPEFRALREFAQDVSKADEFADLLRTAGVDARKIEPLVDALRNETNLLRLGEVLADAGLLEKQAGRVTRVVESLKAGGRVTLDKLITLRDACRAARDSETYAKVAEFFRGIPGATQEWANGVIESFRSEGRVAQLVQKLRGYVTFGGDVDAAVRAASTVDDIIATGKSASWLTEGADLARGGSFMDEIGDGARVTSWLDEAGEGARAASWVDESVASGRAASNIFETGARVSNSAISESLEAIRAGNSVSLEQLQALRQAAQGDELAETLRGMKVAEDKIETLTKTLREERNLAKIADVLESTKVIRAGEGIRGMLRIGKLVPPLAAAAGTAFGAYETYNAFAMASEIENNDELRNVFYARGGASAALTFGNLVVDVGYLTTQTGFAATAMGSRLAATAAGRALAVAGAAALPLTVIFETSRYMISGALDAQAELAMTSNDYIGVAKKQGRDELMHRWYTTGEDLGAGEAYDSVLPLSDNTIDTYRDGRSSTRRKLIEALILTDLAPGGLSAEGVKNYNGYRMSYIAHCTYRFNVTNIAEAQTVLHRSKVFADVMRDRNRKLTLKGNPNKELDLSDSKYDVRNLSATDVLEVHRAALGANSDTLRSKMGVSLYRRLQGLDRNYINFAIGVVLAYKKEGLRNNAHPEGGLNDEQFMKLDSLTAELIPFLRFNGEEVRPVVNISDPADKIHDVYSILLEEDLSASDIEKKKGKYAPSSAGVAMVFELAKYTGYSDIPDEEKLKAYFTEARASRTGIYWDPEEGEWYTNDEGGLDEAHGSDINEAAVSMMEELHNDPDDALGSRFDYITDFKARDDEEKRENQVSEMVSKMKQAQERYNKLHPDEIEEETTVIEDIGEVLEDAGDAIVSVANDVKSGIVSTASYLGNKLAFWE